MLNFSGLANYTELAADDVIDPETYHDFLEQISYQTNHLILMYTTKLGARAV